MVPCLIGLRYTPTHAALVLMIIYAMGCTRELTTSTLADRFGARRTLSADFLSLGIGLVLFLGAGRIAMLAASLLFMVLACGARSSGDDRRSRWDSGPLVVRMACSRSHSGWRADRWSRGGCST
jgi:MFS family permease